MGERERAIYIEVVANALEEGLRLGNFDLALINSVIKNTDVHPRANEILKKCGFAPLTGAQWQEFQKKPS